VRGASIVVLAAVLAGATALTNPAMSDEDQIRTAIGGFVAADNAGDAPRSRADALIKARASAAPRPR